MGIKAETAGGFSGVALVAALSKDRPHLLGEELGAVLFGGSGRGFRRFFLHCLVLTAHTRSVAGSENKHDQRANADNPTGSPKTLHRASSPSAWEDVV